MPGAKTELVSPAQGEVQGWNHHDKADKFRVDVPLDAANAENYDALLLPGGVVNPDQFRILPKAVELVKSFFKEGKPVAAICHGPRLAFPTGTRTPMGHASSLKRMVYA